MNLEITRNAIKNIKNNKDSKIYQLKNKYQQIIKTKKDPVVTGSFLTRFKIFLRFFINQMTLSAWKTSMSTSAIVAILVVEITPAAEDEAQKR